MLVDHLWQSTVFALAAWLLTVALRKNEARVRHGLWMLASAKFLAPFSLLIAAGERLHTPRVAAATPALSAVMTGFAQPFSAGLVAQSAARVPAAAAAVAGTAAMAGRRADLLPIMLLALWAGGALLLLARWTLRWWRIRAAVRIALPLDLGLALPVLSAPLHLEPGVFGIVRPLLLLPRSVNERLSPAQLDAIIAHELCHVRRRDNLTAALHMVVEAIFWFHPAVWWIGAKLWEERERACDEAVLESRRGALVYAEGILNVCKAYVEAPMSCVAGVMGSDLKKRIGRIVAQQVAGKLDLSRKLLLTLAALLVVAAPVTTGLLHAAQAQAQTAAPKTGIDGTWQGTLHAGPQDLRIVVKLEKTEPGGLKATMYSIDQQVPPLPASSTGFEGGVLKFAIQMLDGSYEGKMSSDRQSIAGDWQQGPASLPLVLERATPATEWAIPEPPAAIPPMAADAKPGFEFATIKPSKPDQPGKILTVRGMRMITMNTTMVDLINFSYGVQNKQLVNAPSWLESDKFDVTAQPDTPGTPNTEQLKVMIQKLLADRLQLKLHREPREMSAYVLTVAKNGPNLKKSEDQSGLPGLMFQQLGVLAVHNATMADFTGTMQQMVLDRPVVDQTGLQGKWDFILKWTPDESQFAGLGMKVPAPSDAADAPPPLFTAIQEQIGLKLSVEKAPVPVLVIDHIERPSGN
jgi:uncharacterized protein (TIGR03435 family)